MSPPDMRRPRHGSGADADTRPEQPPESYKEDVATVGALVAEILDAFVPETPLEPPGCADPRPPRRAYPRR